MEAVREVGLLRRVGGAVVLAVLTGLAVALFAQLAQTPASVDYVTPHEYVIESTGHAVSGHITDPRSPHR